MLHRHKNRFTIHKHMRRALSGASGLVGLAMLLASCSSTDSARYGGTRPDHSLSPPAYSIVCVIHGDGEYVYHDTRGEELKADEVALAGAMRVGEKNPEAEVFIFHEKPKSNALLFFPVRDGDFYYYRNGRLHAQESYWRDPEHADFRSEVEIYRRFHVSSRREMVNVFLYMGHEIPESGGEGYDESYPDRAFTVHDLASGMEGFIRQSMKFDLMILSTCFGGTPYTIGVLGPYAQHIVASPENLHLTYFDLRPLERLDIGLRDASVPTFAKEFARRAFNRLTSDIQTGVSVGVYHVDSVQNFVRSVRGAYEQTLVAKNMGSSVVAPTVARCDCAELPAFMKPTMNDGVSVLYRPARFGKSKDKQNHSGWKCWAGTGGDVATTQVAPRIPDAAGGPHDDAGREK